MNTIKEATTMSRKERNSTFSKLSPLVKVIFMTCILASTNQMFSIIFLLRSVDNNNAAAGGRAASVDVLQRLDQEHEENQRLVQKLKELEQQKDQNERIIQTLKTTNEQQAPSAKSSKTPSTRVLFGVFTYDDTKQFSAYRRRFRELFDLFVEKEDYRVCSLGNYEIAVKKHRSGELDPIADDSSSTSSSTSSSHNDDHNDVFFKKTYESCQYIYTFVIAANTSDNAPTLIGAPVEGKDNLLYPRSEETLQNHTSPDVELAYKSTWTDMTLLNIQENMNDGKSQTWFHYGALIGEELGIDYVGKIDTDTLPYMDRFFDWINVQNRLPPSPHNKNILVGNPVNKDWWWQWKGYALTEEQEAKEQFFKDNYQNHFHIYAQGQCYILSTDLAYFVAEEAQTVLNEGQYDHLRAKNQAQGEQEKKATTTSSGNLRRGETSKQSPSEQQQQQQRYGDYIEGHEDHDVAAMAFHSPYPIQFQFLTKYQLFWKHGIKNKKGVNAGGVWTDEVNRMREWIPLQTNLASSDQPKNDRSVQINSMAYTRR